jgi:ribulose-5-phosphate 4-epimerase/fuculose-1-phosphate aldolase
VDKNSFWVNPFGVAFSLINKSDLIRVSEEGDIIDGGPVRLLNSAAFMIHSAIHKARPDVNAAAHSHSIYGRSFCTLGRKLDIITQDSCAFYEVSQPECLQLAASHLTRAYQLTPALTGPCAL